MAARSKEFEAALRAEIEGTALKERLGVANAIVLERVARGGGETHWYFCPDSQTLEIIKERLKFGSDVRFYFDGRIATTAYGLGVHSEIEQIIHKDGECVVGFLSNDGVEISVDYVASIRELEEFADSMSPRDKFFFGAFPGRDHDNVNAISITVPDNDGIKRLHPH